jgi:RES domain
MDYALRAEPGAIEIHGGEARGILGAEYTGREIDVGKGYALAKQWLESHETSRECPLDIETRFLTSLASATEGTLEGPWFRGRFFREPPNSVFDFGPPPAERTRQGRYNKEGHPVLYLCSSPSGGVRELGPPGPGEPLWFQRFRLPSELKILDVRRLSDDSFASAVFWAIESSRDRSAGDPPRLGARITELIALRYDGMLVPGVRGEPGAPYSNVVIFGPGGQWKSYIEPGSTPERSTRTTSCS